LARIRSIKPGFWTDEKLTQLSRDARLTFLGLISAMADDAGRCKGDTRLVKASVWPLDEDIDTADIGLHLEQLEDAGVILIYQHGGARFIQIVNWKKHQRIDKPRPSEYPEPQTQLGAFQDDSKNHLRIVAESSALDTDTDTEGDRERDKEAEREASAAPPAAVLAALQLPKGCVDFLSLFYEPALRESQRQRYRDIVQQMYDALDPNHKGPKIRGGLRVKARDMDHLERECKAVINDPPRDRDMAIVFLLKRLTNPEPGPTVSEKFKASETARIEEEEAYQREARDAGREWAKTNPELYAPILAQVEAGYVGVPESAFSRMAKQSALVTKCAAASGFPSFDEWRTGKRPTPPPIEKHDYRAIAAGDR
jgi:hypothetical protein